MKHNHIVFMKREFAAPWTRFFLELWSVLKDGSKHKGNTSKVEAHATGIFFLYVSSASNAELSYTWDSESDLKILNGVSSPYLLLKPTWSVVFPAFCYQDYTCELALLA